MNKSIYSLSRWSIESKHKSNIIPGDYIYQAIVDLSGTDLPTNIECVWISKDNFDNLVKGVYTFDWDFDSKDKIILFDENGNKISPVKKPVTNEEINNVR